MSNPILKKKREKVSKLIVLSRTKFISDDDTDLFAKWDVLKGWYKEMEKDQSVEWVDKAMQSIVNSIVYQERIYFCLSRENIRKLLQNDKNWKEPLKLDNNTYSHLVAELLDREIISVYDDTKRPTIYKLIDPDIKEMIKVDSEEEQLLQVIDFRSKNNTFFDENLQTDNQTDIQTDNQTDTDKVAPPQVSEINRLSSKIKNIFQTDNQTDIQTDNQTDIQTDNQTDIQTDNQTDPPKMTPPQVAEIIEKTGGVKMPISDRYPDRYSDVEYKNNRTIELELNCSENLKKENQKQKISFDQLLVVQHPDSFPSFDEVSFLVEMAVTNCNDFNSALGSKKVLEKHLKGMCKKITPKQKSYLDKILAKFEFEASKAITLATMPPVTLEPPKESKISAIQKQEPTDDFLQSQTLQVLKSSFLPEKLKNLKQKLQKATDEKKRDTIQSEITFWENT